MQVKGSCPSSLGGMFYPEYSRYNTVNTFIFSLSPVSCYLLWYLGFNIVQSRSRLPGEVYQRRRVGVLRVAANIDSAPKEIILPV